MLITLPNPRRSPLAAETGKTVSMRQAIAFARSRKPDAVALPKRKAVR